MGPEDLEEVLKPLALVSHPDLLVGLDAADDAAVYRLNSEQAVIQTVDFFPPVVDDAYTYGAIAAVNSMSDVYAMGGEVLLALNIVAFPDDLPKDILTQILQGGADKVIEAGAVVAGGHTVTDKEPKFGLCVTGIVHPDRILTKKGIQPGDALYLTKPLGTGVITTALKQEKARAEDVEAAVASMLLLNRAAARAALEAGVHACTDITGFGLLGHAWEMASQSAVSLHLSARQMPFLPGALDYAEAGIFPGGMWRNRDHLTHEHRAHVAWEASVPEPLLDLLFDPETSGGLLIAVAPERAGDLEAACQRHGQACWHIGRAELGAGIQIS